MPPVLRTDSRRLPLAIAWAVLAALPIAYIASVVVATSRNIVFWDEFDTALDLILRIDAGAVSDGKPTLPRFSSVTMTFEMTGVSQAQAEALVETYRSR